MTDNWKKLFLAAGFLCLAGAALAAHGASATRYELSIYAGTPTAVWVLLAGAFLVALALAFSSAGRLRALALTLGSAATTLLVSMLLVRDYRYVGSGDALTHLGWAKGIAGGALEPIQLLYPAIHSISVELYDVAGGSLERDLLLVTVLFAMAYVIATGILVRRMTDSKWGLTSGVISAWLLLPIINVAAYMMPFPTTQAIFFAPFVLFALVFFLQRGDATPRIAGLGGSGLLLLVFGSALLLIHPQQSVNVVLLLAAIAGVQAVYRRKDSRHAIASHQSVLLPTLVLSALLAVWIPTHPRSESALSGVINYLVGGVGAPSTIAQRGASLTELGAGLPVVFLKLFGVSLVFIVLAGLAVLSLWFYRSGTRETGSFVAYLAGGGVPLLVLFVLYFLSTPTMAFRELAFAMVVVTVLGAIEMSHLFDSFGDRFSNRSSRAVTVSVLAVLLVLSALTVFPSPYIYKPTGHVTDQQIEGYQSAFDYRADGQDFSGIRTGPGRFAHAVFGVDEPTDLATDYHGSGIPETTFQEGNYTETYDDGQYLVVTRADYEREVELYNGLRYTEGGFERLSRTPGVNKVMTNGVLDFYDVVGAS